MVSYEVAQSWWGGHSIKVLSPTKDHEEAQTSIPVSFVRLGGDNSLSFVHFLMEQLFLEPGALSVENSGPLDMDTAPVAFPDVTYKYKPVSGQPAYFTPRRGPEGKSPIPRAASAASESTYSDSKRTSSRSGQVCYETSRNDFAITYRWSHLSQSFEAHYSRATGDASSLRRSAAAVLLPM